MASVWSTKDQWLVPTSGKTLADLHLSRAGDPENSFLRPEPALGSSEPHGAGQGPPARLQDPAGCRAWASLVKPETQVQGGKVVNLGVRSPEKPSISLNQGHHHPLI